MTFSSLAIIIVANLLKKGERMENLIIRKYRIQKKYSQAKLAESVGITQSAIAKFENGRIKPTVPTAKKIAEVLGFDWTELFREEGC